MKRVIALLLALALPLALASCQKNDGSLTVKRSNGDEISLRLMDVWQDDNKNVMVSLEGMGKGTLFDIVDETSGHTARPRVSVRIFSDGAWLGSRGCPQGMFTKEGNGSYTLRYATTVMPTRVEVSDTVLELEKLKLPGVDRQSLLDAEKEAYRQQEEAEQKRLDEAVVIAPKAQPDLSWISGEKLAPGESLYYAVTGLENADAVVVSFILSADGRSAHDFRADMTNAQAGRTTYDDYKYVLKMSAPVEDGRLYIEKDALLLEVSIHGDAAEGVFALAMEDGNGFQRRTRYVDVGIARVEMKKR